MKKRSGFTLIELIVTIAVMAIIAMMAAPSFREKIAEKRLKKNALQLVEVLNESRSNAVIQRENIEIELIASSTAKVTDNTDHKIYWALPDTMSFHPDSVKKIQYSMSGALKNTLKDQKIILCSTSSKKSQIIKVSRMGAVQAIEEGTCP